MRHLLLLLSIMFFAVGTIAAQDNVWICTSPKAYAFHTLEGCHLLNRCTYSIEYVTFAKARQLGKGKHCGRCPAYATDTKRDSDGDERKHGEIINTADCSEIKRRLDSLQDYVDRMPRIDSLVALVVAAGELVVRQEGTIETMKRQLLDVSIRHKRLDSLLVDLTRKFDAQIASKQPGKDVSSGLAIGVEVDAGLSASTRFAAGRLTHLSVDYGAAVLARITSKRNDLYTSASASQGGIGVVIELATLHEVHGRSSVGWVLRFGGIVKVQDMFSLSIAAPIASAFTTAPVLDGAATKLTWHITSRPWISSIHAGIIHERNTNTIVPIIGVSLNFGAVY